MTLTWQQLLETLEDYLKYNPKLLNQPAKFKAGDGSISEICNIERLPPTDDEETMPDELILKACN